MPKGELYINGLDAYDEYGLSLESSALSALMTPPPNKPLIENKSRQEHGKRVINSVPFIDERELNLQVHIKANNTDEFIEKYLKFCDVLALGSIEIKTRYEKDKVYRLNYLNCTQFTEYRMGLAKFILRLNEPNPSNRNP
jgi:hypothetical protein